MNQIDRNRRLLAQVRHPKKILSTLIKKLDKVFSEFIRLRDADENGICRCISCGARHHWKEMDNGHYIKRQHMVLRYDTNNCHAQCRTCNWLKQGNDSEYRKALVTMWDESEVIRLEWFGSQTRKWSAFELEYLIKDYSQKVTELKKIKGCH
jgi:hypothetical protein